MKTLLLKLLIASACFGSTTVLMAQDPRTPISSLPYHITMQGSYYLTANLTATGSGGGITISADNVTLDLNGFALVGGGSGQVAGINVPDVHKNIQIRNGTVRGWTNGGVNAVNATNSVVEKLRLSNNSASSTFSNIAALSIGSHATVKECFVTQNTNCHGITAGPASLVTGCVVSGNSAGAGIRAIDRCYIINNVSDSNSTGITMGSGNRIESNSCTSNTSAGVFVPSGATNNVLVRNTARSNNPNYNIASGNRYGTIANLTPGGSGAAFGDSAPTTIITSDPWANFAY
jgi:hypothetical protein